MEVTESVFAQTHEKQDATPETEIVEAEFVETSAIRRAPANASRSGAASNVTPRVSMDLDRWLAVDHQLHELYNLVEIAIMQRDDARAATDEAETMTQVIATRLREWKTYARSLEQRLHEAQIENVELSFAVKRSAEIASEAIAAPTFARTRKRQLRKRLAALGDDIGY